MCEEHTARAEELEAEVAELRTVIAMFHAMSARALAGRVESGPEDVLG